MPYIGRSPEYGGLEKQLITADSSTTTFALTYTVGSESSILVSVAGVLQQPGSAYNLSGGGTNIVFTAAPTTGSDVFVVFLGRAYDSQNIATGAVTGQTELGTSPAADDMFLMYDDNASALKKVAYSDLESDTAAMAANTVKVRDANTSGVPSNKAVADTQILIGDGTGFTAAALSGDVTMTNAGVVSLAANSVDTAELADNAVGLAEMAGLARGKLIYGDASGDPAALAVGTADQVLTSNGTDVVWADSLGIDDNATAIAITIDSSERVGINDTTPSVKLDIGVGTGSEDGINIKSSGAAGNSSRLTANAGDDGQLELFQSTGTSIVKLVGDATTENYVKATLNMYDNQLQRAFIRDYSEVKTNLVAAATIDIDLEEGNVFQCNPNQNTTFTFSNPAISGRSCSFTLIWTQDSSDRTITWPGTVDWAGGSAPDVTSGSGKIDVYTFFTLDAGTIWYGFQAGADMG